MVKCRIAMKTIVSLFLAAFLCAPVGGSPHGTGAEPTQMLAKGTFDVTVTPQQPDNSAARGAGLSRLSLEKRFHGGLEGTSQGEMLALGDGTASGGYVAIEKVTGTLDGRSGSFALLHSAVMRGTTPEDWKVRTVPDSGTGGLAGLEGTMTITIAGGKHEYQFEYTLPAVSR
jgi:hypothetical protein